MHFNVGDRHFSLKKKVNKILKLYDFDDRPHLVSYFNIKRFKSNGFYGDDILIKFNFHSFMEFPKNTLHRNKYHVERPVFYMLLIH